MTKLAVQDLHLSYGDNAILKGVSMALKQGEVVSLLGPSGSGKTTLLRAVAGLEVPHKGTIQIEDKPAVKRAISPQPVVKPIRVNAPNSVFALGNSFAKP